MKKRSIYYNVVMVLICLFAYGFNIFSFFEYKIEDRLFQRPGIIDPNIYVIGIDDESLNQLGPFNTWSRTLSADLINVLNSDPENAPAVIAFDISFYGNKTAEEDAALVEAAKKAGNVILASSATFGGQLVGSKDEFYMQRAAINYETAFEELNRYTHTGHVNTVPDSDGIIRKSLHKINVDGKDVNSFGYEIYKMYTGQEVSPPLNNDDQWNIAYTSLPFEYYGSSASGMSFVKVINGGIPPEMFAGSIVIVGPMSSGMMDAYYTPMSSSVQMNGVEIHANIVQALLEENFKRDVSKPVGAAIIIISTLLCILLLNKLDIKISTVIIMILLILYVFCSVYIYEKGFVVTVVYPVFSVALIYISRILYNYITEIKERRKITDIFKKYVSPQVVENIIHKGENELKLGGMKKDIAVLFVDIRGFTSISENIEPEKVVEILNEYLSITTNAIFNNNGTVDKFIGDATMAIFNAPIDLEDYTFRAMQTALDIVKGAEYLEEKIMDKFGIKIGFGIGVHCGPAIVGNIGTDFRMEYTAIGDTVNTASRLESNAKAGQILISKEVCARLRDRINTTTLGEIQLKGKSKGFEIYQLDSVV